MSKKYNKPTIKEYLNFYWGRYSQWILIPLMIVIFVSALCITSWVDGGAEQGAYPVEKTATVQVVITLDDGNTYVVEEEIKDVTINTYGVSDETQWEIVKY